MLSENKVSVKLKLAKKFCLQTHKNAIKIINPRRNCR